MNFLSLCQRAVQECGVASGTAVAAALPTVIGATGSLARIVNWIGDSWSEIQTEASDWSWMRSSNLLGAGVSFATVAAQASYPLGVGAGTVGVAVDNFGKWDIESFRSYNTSAGTNSEIFLDCVDFDVWRDGYMMGAMRSVQTQPVIIAVGPNQSLNLGPPPNANYTITADYFSAPTAMALDADVPTGLPVRFHLLIVYRAMQKCGQYESAPELFQRGTLESTRMMKQLQMARGQRISFGGSLA